ncbi:unnamed protein product [Prorocentrum cordatum]|uniref:Uncharacterized protein n=1 Tax=Prorocentrum cordatum TaxID=2364126 RepID=A0ABN9S4K0_9DINO|nr:unnamed protein product [Polarella glacialis]
MRLIRQGSTFETLRGFICFTQCSMNYQDCSTDADWVQLCRKQRANRSSGDMASLASKVGANNPAQITPAMMDQSAPSGDTDKYTWRQTEDRRSRGDLQEGGPSEGRQESCQGYLRKREAKGRGAHARTEGSVVPGRIGC